MPVYYCIVFVRIFTNSKKDKKNNDPGKIILIDLQRVNQKSKK